MIFARIYHAACDFMSVQVQNPRLVAAQYHAFVKQIPLMYFILLTNTWALSLTHLYSSPVWLTLYIPAILTIIGILRAKRWYVLRSADPPMERKVWLLRQVNRFSAVFAALYSAWALMLYPYGDSYQQSHTAFYMAVTIAGCIFCLNHLRSAALISVVVVNSAFVAYFAMTGIPVYVAISFNMFIVTFGIIVTMFGNYRDFHALIAAQERAEALGNENFKLANSDSLTGLPNRRAFFSLMDKAASRPPHAAQGLVIGMVDLDGFKLVNDTYGHFIGDKLLNVVATRLAQLVHYPNLIARMGGDEFALILQGKWTGEQLQDLGKAIIKAIEEPICIGNDTMTVSACVGFAIASDRIDDAPALLDQADFALYSAKRHARGQTVIFSDAHLHSIVADKRIERLLCSADFSRELIVHFQPIVRIPDGKTIGFEALARWTSPVLGPVSPVQFIPIAERTGQIQEISLVLLARALATAKNWEPGLRLSFNLSSKDIGTPESILRIIATVMASGMNPRNIDFEITETAIINDFAQAQRSIDALRNLGCGISLDDFGTGYSSLSYLHGLALTKIKIDRSFVRNLQDKPTSLKIVKSLLALSNDMNLDCIVEGVETQAEYEKLLEIGCTKIQGYFFSRPMGEAELETYLSDRQSMAV